MSMTDTTAAPAAPVGGVSDLLNSAATAPAAPPAPGWMPAGFPVTPAEFDAPEAVAARAEIREKIGDKDFYKNLVAERERGVTGPASQAWAELHKRGYPSPPSASSVDDVNSRAAARNEAQWNSFFQGLRAQWPVTPDQEKEIRGGVVREEVRNWALEQRDLMVKDKAFYRRLLDGDVAAKEKWGRVVAILGLRPVKA